MKKEQIARRLARESHISTAAAADQFDRIVTDILTRVRKGQSASLPGLGRFHSGREEDFKFERNPPIDIGGRESKKVSR
jgi:nucleoid DNA-binding protein